MSKLRRLFNDLVYGGLIGAVLGGIAGTAVVLGQPSGGVVNLTNPLTGNELVTVTPLQGNGQLGAYNANVTVLQLFQMATTFQVSSVTTGAVTITLPITTEIFSSALTGAVTVTLPEAPPDGTIVAAAVNASGQNFTFPITVAAGDGDTLTTAAGNVGLLPAGGSAKYRYTAATETWTRVA